MTSIQEIEARVARRAELGRRDSPEIRDATFATTTSGLMRSMASNMVRMADLLDEMAFAIYEMSLTVDAHTAHGEIVGNIGEMR